MEGRDCAMEDFTPRVLAVACTDCTLWSDIFRDFRLGWLLHVGAWYIFCQLGYQIELFGNENRHPVLLERPRYRADYHPCGLKSYRLERRSSCENDPRADLAMELEGKQYTGTTSVG